jgi:hypothetical protein
VLIVGALFLEFGCRVPPPPEDRARSTPTPTR